MKMKWNTEVSTASFEDSLSVHNSSGYPLYPRTDSLTLLRSGCPKLRINRKNFIFTGLPYGKPSRKIGRFPFFFLSIFFRVGKSLACHSPGKWCLCA